MVFIKTMDTFWLLYKVSCNFQNPSHRLFLRND